MVGTNPIGYRILKKSKAAGATSYTVLDALGLDNGYAYCMVRVSNNVTKTYGIRIYTRSLTGTYTHNDVYTLTSGSNLDNLNGALCRIEDGNLIAVHTRLTAASFANLMSHRSTDNGATWQQINDMAANNSINIGGSFGAGSAGFDIKKMRLRSIRGEAMLLMNLLDHNTTGSRNTTVARQYSSIDGCTTFTETNSTDETFLFSFAELVESQGKFLVIYVESSDTAKCVVLPNSFTSLQSTRAYASQNTIEINTVNIVGGSLSNGHFTQGQVLAWEDHTGRLYCAFEDVTSNVKTFFSYVSRDGGFTWHALNTSQGGKTTLSNTCKIWDTDGQFVQLTNVAACMAGATTILFNNHTNSSGITTGGVSALHYGGYSSVAQPASLELSDYYNRIRYDKAWQSLEAPNVLTNIFTQGGTGAGAATVTLNADMYTTIATNNHTRFYSATTTSGLIYSSGYIARAALTVVAGGDTSVARIALHAQVKDATGTQIAGVLLNFSTTAIRCTDQNGPVNLGELSINTTGNGVEVLLALAGGKVSAWAKRRGAGPKSWQAICTAQTVSSSASGTIANEIEFGHFLAITQNDESRWYEFAYVEGARTGTQLAASGYTNPADLYGQFYPVRGSFSYVDGGLQLSTFDGPAHNGDTYTINKRYEYGIENIFHSVTPSPQITYRSTTSTGLTVPENVYSWMIDKSIAVTANGELWTDLVALHLSNINFQNFIIERYDVSGAGWTLAATFDNKIDDFAFTRKGASIVCSAVNTAPYVFANELSGFYIKLVNGPTEVIRKIRSNSSGVISNIVSKQCIIVLEDAQSSDPFGGTATIIPNSCTAIIDMQGAQAAAWRIRITAQKTAEMYFEIGNMTFGAVMPFGRQYSRGREIQYHAGTETDETQDNVMRTRVQSAGYRTVSLAWAEGVDTSNLYEVDPAPDYYTATTSGSPRPVAALNDVPQFMQGVSRLLKGAEKPVVYLPAIPRQSANSWLFNRYNEHILCQLTSDITLENVTGNELQGANAGELFRVASITLREVL